MGNIWGIIKIVVAGVTGAVLGYADHISHPLTVLVFVYGIDVLAGISTDFSVNDKYVSGKKFLRGLVLLCIYSIILFMSVVIGSISGYLDASLIVADGLMFIFSYFYINNTLRNLRLVFPDSEPLTFIHRLLALHWKKQTDKLLRKE